VGAIGREGVSGVPALLGAESAPFRYVVQIPGSALRMTTAELMEAARTRFAVLAAGASLLRRVHGTNHAERGLRGSAYGQTALLPLAAGDARSRRIRPVLADARISGDHAGNTPHERLAGPEEAAGPGIDSIPAGIITIVDRRGLEARSCECYRTVAEFFRRIRDDGP